MISSRFANKPFHDLGRIYGIEKFQNPGAQSSAPYRPQVKPAMSFGPGGAKRWTSFKKIVELVGNMDSVVSALDMGPGRVRDLVEGISEVDSGLAMHIEETLGLPGGWLEDSGNFYELPKSAKEAFGMIPRAVVVPPTILPPEYVPPQPKPALAEVQSALAVAILPEVDKCKASEEAVNEKIQEKVKSETKAEVNTMIEAKLQTSPVDQPDTAAIVKRAGRPSLVTPLTELRRANLIGLTNGKGYKLLCSVRMGVKVSFVSKMLSGLKNMDTSLARDVEVAMDKPSGWMDLEHGYSTDLAELSARQQAPYAPVKTKVKASVQPAIFPEVDFPPAKAPVVALQPEKASAPAAEKTQTPNAEVADGSVGPMADMLIKLIASRARSGELTEAVSYKMIGQLMCL